MTITTEWLSNQLGVPMNAVRLAVQPAKPDKSGNYDMDAVEFGFAWLRRQMDFIERVEIAELLEVEGPTVSGMLKDGILEQDASGRYLRGPTIKRLISWLKERLGDGKSIAAQQKIEERALDIEKKKAELAKITGEWISLEVVKKAWENNVLLARGKLLRLPSIIAPQIAYLRSEAECLAAITARVEEALAEVARSPEYQTEQGEEKAS